MTLACPYCTTPIEAHWKACPACGETLLDMRCNGCDSVVPLGAQTCPGCHKSVDWSPAVTPAAPMYAPPIYASPVVVPPAYGYTPPIVAPPPPVVFIAPKSIGLALLLAMFFGPLGLLYSTVPGALIMLVVGSLAVVLTGGLAVCVIWPICMLWAIGAASSSKQVPTYATGGQGRALLGASLPLTTRRLIVGGIFAFVALLAWMGNTAGSPNHPAVSTDDPTAAPFVAQVPATVLPAATTPPLPSGTPDAPATRQAAAENDRATMVAAELGPPTSEPTSLPTAVQTLPLTEQAYKVAVSRTSGDLNDGIADFGLEARTGVMFSTDWANRMGKTITRIDSICDTILALEAPPRFYATDAQYKIAARHFQAAMKLVTDGINQADDTLVQQAKTEMDRGALAIQEAVLAFPNN